MKINMTVFFCEAITSVRDNFKRIDNIYKLNKYEFYRIAKQSEDYNSKILSDSDFLREEYNKKLLGIVLYVQSTQDQSIINSILEMINNSFNYALSYFRQNKKIYFSKFMMAYVKKCGGIDFVTDDNLNSNFVILHMLCLWNDKEIIENDMYTRYMSAIETRVDFAKDNSNVRINLDHASNEKLEAINKIREELKISDRNSINKYYPNNMFDNMIALLFDYENITTTIFDYVPMTDRDINEIIYLADMVDTANIDNIIILMYLRYLMKAYNSMKKHYFENNKESMYLDFEQIQATLNSANTEIENKNADIKRLQDELKRKDKEIKRLNQEIKDNKLYKDEIISLRNNFFSADAEGDADKNFDIDYAAMADKKYLFLGGRDSLVLRLKEIFKEAIFIDTNNNNFNASLLNNTTKVIIFSNYLNHSFYYKCMNQAKLLNKDVLHISSTSIDLILQKLI
jgi:hypothetical protein